MQLELQAAGQRAGFGQLHPQVRLLTSGQLSFIGIFKKRGHTGYIDKTILMIVSEDVGVKNEDCCSVTSNS